MREVAPGDIVFSFLDREIRAIGIAVSYGYECPKPLEFGSAGAYWDQIGWKVDVRFVTKIKSVRPKSHMDILRPLLPARYSPLQANGDGVQGVYLTELSGPFAESLAGLSGADAQVFVHGTAFRVSENFSDQETLTEDRRKGIEEWEDHIQQVEILGNDRLMETEKAALVKARRGQGLFKERVMRIESACRLTRVDNPIHLRASHIKPWRDCGGRQEERLDGENGILLTPSMDHLFDRGFISFENNGGLILSPRADLISLSRMGVITDRQFNVGDFSEGQKHYLDFHRQGILLKVAA